MAEYDDWRRPSSPTGGVRAYNIAGRMQEERERLYHRMTDEERRWRAQYVKDQILEHPDGEHNLPDDWLFATKNWIRRTYYKPLDAVGYWLVPKIGYSNAYGVRWILGKYSLLFFALWGAHYQMKYNRHDWTKNGGVDVFIRRSELRPDDEGYLKVPDLAPEAFYDRGFSESPLYHTLYEKVRKEE